MILTYTGPALHSPDLFPVARRAMACKCSRSILVSKKISSVPGSGLLKALPDSMSDPTVQRLHRASLRKNDVRYHGLPHAAGLSVSSLYV
jgi:hypothetical protein